MAKKVNRPKSTKPSRPTKRLASKAKPTKKRVDAPRQKAVQISPAMLRRLGDGNLTRGIVQLGGRNDVAGFRNAIQQYADQIDRRTFLEEAAFALEGKESIDVAIEFLGDPNAEVRGANPICQAIAVGNGAFVDALIAAGAHLRAVESQFGRSAVHYAAEVGCPEMVKTCLDAGADVNAQDLDGFAPLSLLCASEYPADESEWAKCAKHMLDAGATVDSDGELMLECVKSDGKLGVMKLLAANGQSLADSQADELGAEVGRLFDSLAAKPEMSDSEMGIEKLEFLVGQLNELVVNA